MLGTRPPQDRVSGQCLRFSARQRATVLPELVSALESLGLEVWEPFHRNNQEAGLKPGLGPTVSARLM